MGISRPEKKWLTATMAAVAVSMLYIITQLLLAPHYASWLRSKDPELFAVQGALRARYPQNKITITDQTTYSTGNQSGEGRVLAVGVIGKSYPGPSKKKEIENTICSALGQGARTYNRIALQSIVEHRFLIFYSRQYQSDAFNCPSGHPPSTTSGTKPVDQSAFQSVVSSSKNSVVKIEGYTGCKDILWGTGFVAGPGLVATNAHVVAGISSPTVIDSSGRHKATPILFDPNQDFAILRVSGLAGVPLPLDVSTNTLSVVGSHDGEHYIVLGYPGGGDFTATPALIVSEFPNEGPDIYGSPENDVDTFQLKASIVPGNSGSPLVGADGKVVGIASGVSPDDSSTAYALPVQSFYSQVQEAKGLLAPVSTQVCAE